MKKFFLVFVLIGNLFGDEVSENYVRYLQNLQTKTKKYRFYKLVLPAVKKVDAKLRKLYIETYNDITNKTNINKIVTLKKIYGATDEIDLLKRIKPHPVSITLAQAAMESAWGTSRFFVEANNVFGVWSKSKDPTKTIVAKEIRNNGHQVYLRKYNSIEESIEHYYKNIATNRAYKRFRQARYNSDDPYEIVVYLDRYSEKKELYPVELIKIIFYNNMRKYDLKAPLPTLKEGEKPTLKTSTH